VAIGRRLGAVWPGAALTLVFGADLAAIRFGPPPFDPTLILLLHTPSDPATPIGPAWLAETGRDLTGLGSNGVQALLVIVIGIGLILGGWRRYAGALLTSFALALAVNAALKVLVHRTRPALVPGMPRVFTTSFPSSHSMVSAATFFTVAAMVAAVTRSVALRRFAFAAAALGTLLVGLSRIYLGVHWPTDVVGGWSAGLLCAWASWRAIGRGATAIPLRSVGGRAGGQRPSRPAPT
jgi:undecaprenyl-diphosphatase